MLYQLRCKTYGQRAHGERPRAELCDIMWVLCCFVFALLLFCFLFLSLVGPLGCFLQGESPMLTKFLNGSKAGLGRPGILGANLGEQQRQRCQKGPTLNINEVNFHLRRAFASAKCSEGQKHCEQEETEHESLRFCMLINYCMFNAFGF